MNLFASTTGKLHICEYYPRKAPFEGVYFTVCGGRYRVTEKWKSVETDGSAAGRDVCKGCALAQWSNVQFNAFWLLILFGADWFVSTEAGFDLANAALKAAQAQQTNGVTHIR